MNNGEACDGVCMSEKELQISRAVNEMNNDAVYLIIRFTDRTVSSERNEQKAKYTNKHKP